MDKKTPNIYSSADASRMYSTNCYMSNLPTPVWTFGGRVITSFRNERTDVTDGMLNPHRNNLQTGHVSIGGKTHSGAAQAEAIFSPFSFPTTSPLTYGPHKAKSATSPWKQRRKSKCPLRSLGWLCIPAQHMRAQHITPGRAAGQMARCFSPRGWQFRARTANDLLTRTWIRSEPGGKKKTS